MNMKGTHIPLYHQQCIRQKNNEKMSAKHTESGQRGRMGKLKFQTYGINWLKTIQKKH